MTEQYIKMVNGVEVPMTADEITARQAEEALPIPLAPLIDRLKAIMFTLSDDVQAQFGEAAAAIDTALRNGKPSVARLELENLTLPSELEPVRQAMLEEFP